MKVNFLDSLPVFHKDAVSWQMHETPGANDFSGMRPLTSQPEASRSPQESGQRGHRFAAEHSSALTVRLERKLSLNVKRPA